MNSRDPRDSYKIVVCLLPSVLNLSHLFLNLKNYIIIAIMSLSTRGQYMGVPSPKNLLWDVIKDLWDPQTNPGGYVNLGVAENALLQDRLVQHALDNIEIDPRTMTFGDGPTGALHIKTHLSAFFNEQLKPAVTMEPGHITLTNGCAAAVEHLSWLLCNPGEGILIGQPFFRGFSVFIEGRTGATIVPVPFSGVDPFGIEAVSSYEAAIIRAREENQPVSALLLCNPHNPTGRCYTRDAIIALMKLCEAHKIHLVSDEIYALSTWHNPIDLDPPPTPFTSVLAIDTSGIIDPSRVHLIWGISKDFGANGLRLGSIVSQANPAIHQGLVPLAGFSSCSSVTEGITARFLSDSVWMADYIKDNKRLLAENYAFMVSWANRHGIPYAPGASAAFFFWVNLGKAYCKLHNLGESTAKVEDGLNSRLLSRKVFLGNGSTFAAEEPGWFRITFAYDRAILEEGLRRINEVLGEGV